MFKPVSTEKTIRKQKKNVKKTLTRVTENSSSERRESERKLSC